MKTTITVPQGKIIADTSIQELCLRLLLTDKDNVSIANKKQVVTISLNDGIKPGMFSNTEFLALMQDNEVSMEGLLLWCPVLAEVLETEVSEMFPYSTIAEVTDEDGKVLTPARQLTLKEYFQVQELGELALIRSKFKRAGNSNYLAEDYPNKQVFGLFYQALFANEMPKLAGKVDVEDIQLMTDEGKDAFVEKYKVEELGEV